MESVWTEVKSEIKKRIPGHTYRMWIEPVRFSRVEEDLVVLSCPNYFSKKRVQNQYRAMIETEIQKISGVELQLDFEVAAQSGRPASTPKSMHRPAQESRQMLLPKVGQPIMHHGRMLKPDFTFDEFVVGKNNDFAYSAALSLATSDRPHNNTLFLLSETGMGKSHLSQAIGHHIITKKPSERVYYITAEDFTNEMIGSIKTKTSDKFKEKYRNKCDVLLLEDIQFLTGKEHTQIELAMTLDYLFESGKKIMFSSCCLPSDIPKMNDQLKSRFSSSVISNIEPPGFKTRVKILRKKARRETSHIPDTIIEYLASELTDDVRQLESGLVGVVAKSSLLGVPINYDLAESVIRNISVKRNKITIDVIKKLVSKEFGITVDDMVSKSRRQSVVRPRQIAMYLSRRYTDQPLQAIGRSFNRYHATAIHAIGSVEKSMKQEVALRNHIKHFSKKLEAGSFR